MNTLKQSQKANQKNWKVDGTSISHASLKTSVRSSIPVARKKQWQLRFSIFLFSLGIIALIVFLLYCVPANIVRQEFEGFGVAICAVACCQFLLWRVFRSFAIEQNLQTQPPAANPSPVSPSGPNPAEPRKVQSSTPPEVAMVPATPVASFPSKTRI